MDAVDALQTSLVEAGLPAVAIDAVLELVTSILSAPMPTGADLAPVSASTHSHIGPAELDPTLRVVRQCRFLRTVLGPAERTLPPD